ncbi:MAG: DegV family protein [Firmicutes bacterium]|nr:DegV family protein [Bacillota bacterium]
MIKVTADSTCDLSPDILKSLGITLVPLSILVEDKAYKVGIDIKPSDIFHYVEKENKICKTAAVNSYEYYNLFKKLRKDYDAIIHVSISSDFSSCYQNATIAAAEFEHVYVIDSRNLSTGSGHIALDAAIMAKEGESVEKICQKLEETASMVDASFVINTLDYLHKGGRCSGLEVFGANLLKIKPSIEVVNGKMKVGKKYRGNFNLCLENYIRDKFAVTDDINTSRLFITHSPVPEGTVELVKDLISSYVTFDEIIDTDAGCTVSSHCGPNTLGVLFKRHSVKQNGV